MDNLEFESKPASLGVSLATPTQKHGDDRVPAKCVRVKGMMLDHKEFILLAARIGVTRSKHAWDMLYDGDHKKGKAPEPFWEGKVKHTIPGKFKDSVGVITFGITPYTVSFQSATISRLSFDEQVGGMVAISFMLQALKGNIRGDLAKLDEYLGSNVNAQISFGDPDDEDEEEEEGDAEQDSLDLTPGGKVDNGEEKPAANSRKRKPADDATIN